MNSNKQSNGPFTPLTVAISDTFLQMKAKPLIFLTMLVLLVFVPRLLLGFAFNQPISKMAMELFSQILDERLNDSDFQITEQNSGVIINGVGAMLLLLLSFLGLAGYIYSVLGDVVASFRRSLPPGIARSLAEGQRRYVSLLKVVLASAGRILAWPAAIAIPGLVTGYLLGQATLIYISLIASLILFLVRLTRYGLAPFVHIARGIVWRSALVSARDYYLTHRLVTSTLCGFVVILPLVFFSLLSYVWFSLGMIGLEILATTMFIVFGILRNIVRLFMPVLLINFAMNNFVHIQEAAVGESPRRKG